MERLHASSGSAYSALEASIHLARYAPVLPLCRGRRVLDLACGEGYGSWMMAQAGASSVDGLDLSDEAIRRASASFSHERLRFEAADGEDFASLNGARSFDLVVCIETIEHVHHPERMLAQIRNSLAAGGMVYMTCPNDHWYYTSDQSNPFHIRKYTFAEFRDLTERVLGAATQWMFGTAALGFLTVPAQAREPDRLPSAYVDAQPLASTLVCQPDPHDRPATGNASYFVGVWGPRDAAVSGGAFFPMSMTRYGQKEDALVQVAELRAAAEEASAAEAHRVSVQLADIRALLPSMQDQAADIARLRQQLTERDRDIARLQSALAACEARASAAEADRGAALRGSQASRIQAAALRAENDVLAESVARFRAKAAASQEREQAAQNAAAEAACLTEETRQRAAIAADQAIMEGAMRHDALAAAHLVHAECLSERLALAEAYLANIRRFIERPRSFRNWIPAKPVMRMLKAYEQDPGRSNLWPPSRAEEAIRQRLIEASGLLDRDGYNAANPDVLEAAYDPVLHYLRDGHWQRRQTGSRFDSPAYLRANPDVVDAGEPALVHFILFGARQMRPLHPAPVVEPSH